MKIISRESIGSVRPLFFISSAGVKEGRKTSDECVKIPFANEMDDKKRRPSCESSSEQFMDIYRICSISLLRTPRFDVCAIVSLFEQSQQSGAHAVKTIPRQEV